VIRFPQFFAASGGQFRGDSAGKFSSPSPYQSASSSMLMSTAPTFTTRQPIPSSIGSTGMVSNTGHALPFATGNIGRGGPESTRTPPPDIFEVRGGGYFVSRG